MSTTSLETSSTPALKTILGYTLQKRIGEGGNSEVWEATNADGFRKAIKLVHGNVEDKRAARELKSLDRIKQLRHPFLLAVDRIEIVDGQLIVITELADYCLEERFQECRASNLPGIPREELLRYMRETGEALDYLFQKHSLQHLDVKPGNLLLIDGQIKVADFGLLKDLQDNRQSLIHGLTPKFAAPEVFDGRPSVASDQYSLAIVYQAMLTGKFPFDGRTAAQLASQHLHGEPNLTALSPLERFAVGKALSKNPSGRFRSCREFVDRLMHRGSATMITTDDNHEQPTEAAGRKPVCGTPKREAKQHDGHTVVVAEPEIHSLPAFDLDGQDVSYRPTIFVGIGGTSGRVLSQLRQTITDRLGNAAELPALQFVYLDTDIDAINAAMSRKGGGALQERETLVLPLRSTEDYRNSDLLRLESISRRWLYNIPRSQRTNGLRALGRLALLDCSQRVLDRLRSAVRTATDGPSVAASSEASGLRFVEDDPRVFVIASAAGGTGSGMVIDIGYAVRQVLAESGFSDEAVCGILTYSTQRGGQGLNLAPANACACLDELRHFSSPVNDYPGELARGLAGFREASGTFKSTYFVNLGDELSDAELDDATERLSEYLYLNCVSPAAEFFDKCRAPENQNVVGEGPRLRTLGLCQYGAEDNHVPPQWVELICRGVVHRWRGGIAAARDDDPIRLSDFDRLFEAHDPKHSRDQHVESLAVEKISELGIDLKRLSQQVSLLIQQELSSEQDTYFRNLIVESLPDGHVGGSELEARLTKTLDMIDAVIGAEIELESDSRTALQIEALREVLGPKILQLSGRIGDGLKQWILGLVDTDRARVDGAQRAVRWMSQYLEKLENGAFQRHRQVAGELESLQASLHAMSQERKHKRGGRRDPLVESLLTYSRLMLDKLVIECVCATIGGIESRVTASSDELRDLWKELNQLAGEFETPTNLRDSDAWRQDLATSEATRLEQTLFERRTEMIDEVDRELESKFLHSGRRLCDVLTLGETRRQLVVELRLAARDAILRTGMRIRFSMLDEILRRDDASELTHSFGECLKLATPHLEATGGAKRLLVTVPENLNAARLQDEIRRISGDEVTAARDPKLGVTVCYEVEDVPLEGIELQLMRRRPDCLDLAKRLHTRVDVTWTSG